MGAGLARQHTCKIQLCSVGQTEAVINSPKKPEERKMEECVGQIMHIHYLLLKMSEV